MNTIDRIFYFAGWMLYILLAAAALLQAADILILTDIGLPCSFRLLTGYFCPGCGGTHAITALAAGDLAASFLYHPFVPYTAFVFAVFVLWNTIALIGNYFLSEKATHTKTQKRYRKKNISRAFPVPFLHFHVNFLYIGLAIIFIQWLVKNLVGN